MTDEEYEARGLIDNAVEEFQGEIWARALDLAAVAGRTIVTADDVREAIALVIRDLASGEMTLE